MVGVTEDDYSRMGADPSDQNPLTQYGKNYNGQVRMEETLGAGGDYSHKDSPLK